MISLQECYCPYLSLLQIFSKVCNTVGLDDRSSLGSIVVCSVSSFDKATTTAPLSDVSHSSLFCNDAHHAQRPRDSSRSPDQLMHRKMPMIPSIIDVLDEPTKFETLSNYATTVLSSTSPRNCRPADTILDDTVSSYGLESFSSNEERYELLDEHGLQEMLSQVFSMADPLGCGKLSDPQSSKVHGTIESATCSKQTDAATMTVCDNTHSKFRRWTREEDDLLLTAVQLESHSQIPNISFPRIAKKYFKNERNGHQCKSRWRKIRPGVNRDPFTRREESQIVEMRRLGLSFAHIAKQLGDRTTDQVRTHYNDKLDPCLYGKKRTWSEEEKAILLDAQKRLGNQWVCITKLLPGRSVTEVKNQWYNAKNKLRRRVQRGLLTEAFEACLSTEVTAPNGALDEPSQTA